MTDSGSDGTLPGVLRFVAYDLTTGAPVMSGTSAALLLSFAGETAGLGIDVRFMEILDCGADGPQVEGRGEPLSAARRQFCPVFRGDGVAELPPIEVASQPNPCR